MPKGKSWKFSKVRYAIANCGEVVVIGFRALEGNQNIFLLWMSRVRTTDLFLTDCLLVHKKCWNQDGGKLCPCSNGSDH